MNPSRTFILRPVATSLLMAGILLVGAVAYKQLPVSALPEVDYPTIQVITFYPGASPDVMASSVTAPLERQFGQVPGLQQMTSTSSDGSSVITLAVRPQPEYRRRRAGGAAVASTPPEPICRPTCRRRPFTARRIPPIRPFSRWRSAPKRCRSRRWRISPIRASRPRSRSCRASAWSASAADRSPRCAFRRIPTAAGLLRPEPGRSAQRSGSCQRQPGQGQFRRRAPGVSRSEPTTSCFPATTMRRWWWLIATARR